MDKKGHQGMSNMAGMLLVSSKMHVGEQEWGRRSEWDEGVTHESAAAPTMARRSLLTPILALSNVCYQNRRFVHNFLVYLLKLFLTTFKMDLLMSPKPFASNMMMLKNFVEF